MTPPTETSGVSLFPSRRAAAVASGPAADVGGAREEDSYLENGACPQGGQRRMTGDGSCDDWLLQSEGDVMRLNVSLSGNIIGDLIAAVIFFVI